MSTDTRTSPIDMKESVFAPKNVALDTKEKHAAPSASASASRPQAVKANHSSTETAASVDSLQDSKDRLADSSWTSSMAHSAGSLSGDCVVRSSDDNDGYLEACLALILLDIWGSLDA